MARRTPEAAAIEAKALAMTRSAPTSKLVASFAITDALMDAAGMTADDRMDIAETRGWIMTVLEERGELALIGFE